MAPPLRAKRLQVRSSTGYGAACLPARARRHPCSCCPRAPSVDHLGLYCVISVGISLCMRLLSHGRVIALLLVACAFCPLIPLSSSFLLVLLVIFLLRFFPPLVAPMRFSADSHPFCSLAGSMQPNLAKKVGRRIVSYTRRTAFELQVALTLRSLAAWRSGHLGGTMRSTSDLCQHCCSTAIVCYTLFS
ncbi:unnamed protein product [Prorocentrum cordatum]|uniref:Uncharacterized protein n=1 Tax=Prorocentrum cordatum TaxID=2364126 RepID=A0ABN9SE77_9DINO|nr:unnamed protein product [Polarella glacialis]